jgi:hypothetical protein
VPALILGFAPTKWIIRHQTLAKWIKRICIIRIRSIFNLKIVIHPIAVGIERIYGAVSRNAQPCQICVSVGKRKIVQDNCVPSQKTFIKILEAGWSELSGFIVKEIYLPKLIDPTHTLYTYIKKYETQVSKFKYLLDDITNYENYAANYKFENFDTYVKLFVKLPYPIFVVEYLSFYCYKDLLKIRV